MKENILIEVRAFACLYSYSILNRLDFTQKDIIFMY